MTTKIRICVELLKVQISQITQYDAEILFGKSQTPKPKIDRPDPNEI
jgi:hypothetical protein